MGALTKRPKTIPLQQPVAPIQYVLPPATTPENEKSDDAIKEESRTESLLRRSRGRFGTILTGFRGFLSQQDKPEEKGPKTLLGE